MKHYCNTETKKVWKSNIHASITISLHIIHFVSKTIILYLCKLQKLDQICLKTSKIRNS